MFFESVFGNLSALGEIHTAGACAFDTDAQLPNFTQSHHATWNP